MSRAASLMLRYGRCGCFYWAVCCLWCTDCCYASRLEEITLSDKLLLAVSLRPNTWQNPTRRTKKMLAILLRAGWIVIARSCDHRPSVFCGMIASRHLVEKNEIFSVFQILFKQTSNAGECVLQQMRKGFQRCGSVIKIIQHETRHVCCRRGS